jgi:hypothetical protein
MNFSNRVKINKAVATPFTNSSQAEPGFQIAAALCESRPTVRKRRLKLPGTYAADYFRPARLLVHVGSVDHRSARPPAAFRARRPAATDRAERMSGTRTRPP